MAMIYKESTIKKFKIHFRSIITYIKSNTRIRVDIHREGDGFVIVH